MRKQTHMDIVSFGFFWDSWFKLPRHEFRIRRAIMMHGSEDPKVFFRYEDTGELCEVNNDGSWQGDESGLYFMYPIKAWPNPWATVQPGTIHEGFSFGDDGIWTWTWDDASPEVWAERKAEAESSLMSSMKTLDDVSEGKIPYKINMRRLNAIIKKKQDRLRFITESADA